MKKNRYREDKPQDCRYCYWYMEGRGCVLDRGCYYELIDEPEEKGEHPCEGCAYARPIPCLGYCLKKLRGELHPGRAGTPAAASHMGGGTAASVRRKTPHDRTGRASPGISS